MFESALGVFILNGALTSAIARFWKGRSPFWWFVIGGFTFGFAILVLIFLPKNQEEMERRSVAKGKSKICPSCKEVIRFDANVCKHCGAEQSDKFQAVKRIER